MGLGLTPGSEVFTPGTGITNWTVSGGDVSIVDAGSTLTSLLGLFTAESGNQYAVLNGLNINILGIVSQSGSAGTLSQSITTVAGKTYQISFAFTGLSLGLLSNNTALQIGVSNATGLTTPTNGLLNVTLGLGWQTETFQFTATGNSSVLSFAQDPAGVNLGLISLDNVTLTPLPEPAQYGEAAVAFLSLLIGARLWAERVGGRTAVLAIASADPLS